MIPSASVVSDHIRFLLLSLDSSNPDTVFFELCEYTAYGLEESVALFRACLDLLDIDGSRDLMSINGNERKTVKLKSVLSSFFKDLLKSPNFSTVICKSMENSPINEVFLGTLCDLLCLSTSERVAFGLALTDSDNIDIRTCGKSFCMSQITELCSRPMAIDSAEKIQQILLFLNRCEELSKHTDAFMQLLSLVQLNEHDHFILSPVLSDEIHEANFFRHLNILNKQEEDDFDSLLAEMEKEMNIADVMNESCYGCTSNVTQCREILSLLSPMDEITVARILATVTRTHAGVDYNPNVISAFRVAFDCSSLPDTSSADSWNAEVLIDSIKQLAPGINWGVVFENLDLEGFYVPSEEAFLFFMSMYKHACQDPFPLHVCCSMWENIEGQLSFLKYAVSVPPEVFTFAHSRRQLASMDAVNEHKLQLNSGNHAWLCLDLLEVLCLLAERGHATAVRSILHYPLEHCPELLLLGMAYINTAYNFIQNEVSMAVFVVVLKTIPRSGMISHLWHVNPSMLLRGFADALSADQDYVFKILDVCQELKILLQVLDMLPSFFAIRLAVVASAKEVLDLEKFVLTNLTAYKDIFVKECIRFLKEVHAGDQDVSMNRLQHSAAIWSIYSEISPVFLKVLQSHAGLLPSHLHEEMEKLWLSYMRTIPEPKNSGGVDSVTTDIYDDYVEAEVNSYFHQIFSGQLSSGATIQMLTRLKESPDIREKSIFDGMIAILIEEYKFFNKFPKKQLKIAAVLFGSLIKHQLVTHTNLGVALRVVLDALQKPAYSEMFVFGTKALEQFVYRLIEWPQYCYHILEISHLRARHSYLVSSIERALARISSGHLVPVTLHGASGIQFDVNQALPQPPNLKMPVLSFNLTGSGAPLHGSQVLSPCQLSQRQHRSLEETKISPSMSNCLKPLTSVGQSTSILSSGASGVRKPQNAVTTSAAVSSSAGFVCPSRPVTPPRFGSAMNIKTLVTAAERRETPIEVPAIEIQDKISFIMNSLSAANIEAKVNEFMDILKEQYFPWFARYMVMNRTSIEPNFHDLYLEFFDKVNSKLLKKEIRKASYENCKVLLESELIRSRTEERSLLKNLGSWLGKITIARNQVLRASEIDLKSLIIEAYEKDFLIAAIPFTSKILEACQSSTAYRPPNPWTMSILGLLAEINAMPDVKQSLAYDIEILFKYLGVDKKDVSPTSLLKDKLRKVEGNPDLSYKDVRSSSQQMVGEGKTSVIPYPGKVELPTVAAGPAHPLGYPHVLSQYAPHNMPSMPVAEDEKLVLELPDQFPLSPNLIHPPLPFAINQIPAPVSNFEQQSSTLLSNFELQVIVNTRLYSSGLYLPFQSVLKHAMKISIQEIMPCVVKHSVSIATQTTKVLVLKDYAMEMNENFIREEARLMVAYLAGSLAHVKCMDLLRNSISNQLRISLQGLNISNDLFEQAVILVTNDNLDLGCTVIQQAATETAVQTIYKEMSQQLLMRRKHREDAGPTFFDSNMYAEGSIGGLAEALRPKPGRVSASQRVCETQSGQISVAAAPPASSVRRNSQGFLPTTGQINSKNRLTGVINAPLVSAVQPSEISLDDIDTTTALNDLRSAHVVAKGALPHNLETENVVKSFPSLASELHPVEPSVLLQESGAESQINQNSSSEGQAVGVLEPLLTTSDALEKYQMVSKKLENLLLGEAKESVIQGVVADVPAIIMHCISRDEAAMAVAQKAFKALYENSSNSVHVSSHLAILAAIRVVSKLAVKELTSWVIYSDEIRKFNKDITTGLIRSELLNLAEYDVHMSKLLDSGRNKVATDFAISLVHTLVTSDSRFLSELQNLVDTLAKLALRPESPESLQQLVESVKNLTANASAFSGVSIRMDDNTSLSKVKKGLGFVTSDEDYNSSVAESVEPDSANFNQQVTQLFDEWYGICDHPMPADDVIALFVSQLHKKGLLKGDNATAHFFCRITEISVSRCRSSEAASSGPSQQPVSFLAIDAYAKLTYSVLKFSLADHGSSILHILPKVLAVTVKHIHTDAEKTRTNFNAGPYFRLFKNWILDLGSFDPGFDGANFQILIVLANTFHALQPLKVPAFSFAWLELVSSRNFMPKLLTVNAQKGWPLFQRLLVDLFLFMEPFLKNANLGELNRDMYKATLRVLLVLEHDFPEFLCDYHFSLCDVISPNCIQMRNIILSAFPKTIRLLDPSTPNLEIDLLPEIHQSPRILSEIDAALKANQMKNGIDEYLKQSSVQISFHSDLKFKLLLSKDEAARAGIRYNVPLINSLVLYVGIQTIQQLEAGAKFTITNVAASLRIFQALILDLDLEGVYILLNALANQLRYPNKHTNYFSYVILFLFTATNQEPIQELITRVLLERAIIKPQPWGLLFTFHELIENSKYDFWSRSFSRRVEEIQKLMENLERSRSSEPRYYT